MSDNLRLSLEILRRIPKNRYTSAPEIHTQLANIGYERSLRSIERQLKNISEQFDIERDTRSKPYGYKWKPQSKGFNLPTMSAEESVLLTLAEKHLESLLPNKLFNSLSSYFQNAKATLLDSNIKSNKPSKAWLGKVDIVSPTQPLVAPDINSNVLATVSNALFDNRWLTLTYKNANDYQQEYRVMPLALVQQDVRIYLVCRFDGFDNERNLATHRILKAEAQTLSFKRPSSFNLKDYIAKGRFGVSEEQRIILEFSVLEENGKHLLETPLSKSQTVSKNGDYLNFSAEVIDSEILDRWLNSFGDAIKKIKKTKI